jgi:hypothetical protein
MAASLAPACLCFLLACGFFLQSPLMVQDSCWKPGKEEEKQKEERGFPKMN